MKAVLLLADFAQVADGKLNIIGAGWSILGPMPVPTAIAAKLEIPWDQTNIKHNVVLELNDEDGHPVTFPGPTGPQPVRVEVGVEVGRPPGVRPGTPIDAPIAVNIGPLPLPPDRRFTWKLSIDGETHADWQVSFSTLAPPPGFSRPATEGSGPG